MNICLFIYNLNAFKCLGLESESRLSSSADIKCLNKIWKMARNETECTRYSLKPYKLLTTQEVGVV